MELCRLTIHEASELLANKQITSRELTESLLGRISEIDPEIGAFITVTGDEALAQADAADAVIAGGNQGPLTGVPLALKDLICTSGVRTTCASRILENFVPPYDATVAAKLKHAGYVLLGKLNMDEFAMGSSTENSGLFKTRNPWDTDRIPGGSSGGSAAAVAADLCIGALGSDTGGSIRQPASHCGVVGMKPTYGRVSRYGLVAFASSLDQIGPLTKDVTDCALLMNTICGHDPADSTSAPEDVPDFLACLNGDIKGLTIGLPVEYSSTDGLDPQVASAVKSAVDTLKGLGAEVKEVSLPNAQYAVAAYYVIAPSEASSNLARYDGVKYGYRDKSADGMIDMYRLTRTAGFGAEVQRRIIIGTYCLSAGYYDAYYGKASQVRTLIREDFRSAFDDCDVIVSPVAPTPAFRIGENTDDPLTMYLSDIFTLSANLAGIPGMSVPCGFSEKGLPIGLQLMGKHFDESTLLRVAYAFEQATDFHKRKPEI
jgi:aspartyl-tRNA(Asn)/glutamyl-tRNA(Gln) amidotransferase subunit A